MHFRRWMTNTLICIQAGNVNTGAFDPAREICETCPSSRSLGACRWRLRPVGARLPEPEGTWRMGWN